MSRLNLNNYALWTALITPMTSNGKVDYSALTELVRQQQDAGNGILLLGSTGEGLALSGKEHKDIVAYVVSLKPAVPLMVAVGGFDLAQQTQWIEHCNKLAIDAYLLSSPIYAKPGKQGQLMWFRELLRAANKPCMIYNVPSRSGINLNVDTLSLLCDQPYFWAIKEASGDLACFHRIRLACPNIKLFSGDDALFPKHAADGALGLVSVCANAWPKATHRYVRYHLDNRQAPIASTWSDALANLGVAANPIPVKVLMHRLSVINTPYLRSPLTHLEMDNTDGLLQANHNIRHWFEQTNIRASNAVNQQQNLNPIQTQE